MNMRNKKSPERLTGSAFQPLKSRKIDRGTHPQALHRADKKAGKRVGSADAGGVDYVAGTGELPYEQVVENQKQRALAEATERYHPPLDNAEKTKTAADKEAASQARKVQKLQDKEQALLRNLHEDENSRGPHPVVYGIMLFALAVISLPAELTAAAALPLPPSGQVLVAVGIGGLLCMAAHKAGALIHSLVDGWEDRKRRPARHLRDAILLGACLTGPLALILTFGSLRAANLELIARLTGDETGASAGSSNGAFVALQIAVLCVAVAFAVAWAAGKERRRLEKALAILGNEIKDVQARIDEQEKVVEVATRTIQLLMEELAKEHASISAFHGERLERYREERRARSAKVQLRQRRWARFRSREAPQPPDDLLYPGPDPRPDPPPPALGARLAVSKDLHHEEIVPHNGRPKQ